MQFCQIDIFMISAKRMSMTNKLNVLGVIQIFIVELSCQLYLKRFWNILVDGWTHTHFDEVATAVNIGDGLSKVVGRIKFYEQNDTLIGYY